MTPRVGKQIALSNGRSPLGTPIVLIVPLVVLRQFAVLRLSYALRPVYLRLSNPDAGNSAKLCPRLVGDNVIPGGYDLG